MLQSVFFTQMKLKPVMGQLFVMTLGFLQLLVSPVTYAKPVDCKSYQGPITPEVKDIPEAPSPANAKDRPQRRRVASEEPAPKRQGRPINDNPSDEITEEDRQKYLEFAQRARQAYKSFFTFDRTLLIFEKRWSPIIEKFLKDVGNDFSRKEELGAFLKYLLKGQYENRFELHQLRADKEFGRQLEKYLENRIQSGSLTSINQGCDDEDPFFLRRISQQVEKVPAVLKQICSCSGGNRFCGMSAADSLAKCRSYIRTLPAGEAFFPCQKCL